MRLIAYSKNTSKNENNYLSNHDTFLGTCSNSPRKKVMKKASKDAANIFEAPTAVLPQTVYEPQKYTFTTTNFMKNLLFVFCLFFFASLQAQEAGKIRYTTRVQWDDSLGVHHTYDCHGLLEADEIYLVWSRTAQDGISCFEIDKRNCFRIITSKLR